MRLNKFTHSALLCLLSFIISGCFAKEPLGPGRCETNKDCRTGDKCENTYCVDIYHPRYEIKNY